MRPIRLLLRWFIWFGVLLILLVSAVFALLITESGTAWTLRQTPGLLRPLGVEFSFSGSDGSLFERLQLKDVQLRSGETRFTAARLLLHWQPWAITEHTLHIKALELDAVQLMLPVPVERDAGAPEIPDIVLPIALRLDRFLLDRLQFEQGETHLTVTQAALAAQLNTQGLEIRDLHYAGGGVQLAGILKMQTTSPHTLAGELSAIVDQSLTGEQVGAVKASAVLAGAALQPEFELSLTAPTELRLHGSLQLNRLQPGFNLTAEWPALSWPLQGVPAVTARSGRLQLQGETSAYQLELKTGLNGEGIPAGDVELAAEGNLKGINLQPLKLAVLEGGLQVTGKVDWDELVRWDLELLADHLNPGLYQPEWPGRIDGRIEISGSYGTQPDGQIALQSHIHRLGGQLRGQTISASGGLDYAAGELQAHKLEIASGPNRVYLDGRAAEQLNLSFDIKAPELASLFPGLAGRLEGAGVLKGTRSAPAVTAELHGTGVGYQEMRTQNIKLNLDWQQSGGSGELLLTGLDAAGLQVSEISADLAGTPAAHRLNLSVDADAFNVAMSAKGGLLEQTWNGELARLALAEPSLGEWLLQAPVKLQLSESAVRSERVCMQQTTTVACVEGGWSKQKGLDIVGGLKGFDLARLAEHMPGEAVIEGGLRGDFKLSGSPEKPNLQFMLLPGDGLIRIKDEAQPFELAYRNAKVEGRFANDEGSVDLNFELGSSGRATGRLILAAETAGTRALGGKVSADFPDLALLTGFIPVLEQVQGRLHLETVVGGTLAKPQLNGVLQIEHAQAEVLAAGITLADLQLSVRGDGKTPLRVQGAVSSGKGKLTVDGSVDIAAAGGPGVDLTLKGENFQAARLPEALVEISPDLRLQGNGPFHLSGNLLIPKAVIEIRELPSGSVAVSDDEIVVGQESTQKRAAGSQNLTARVRVALGKLVTFNGFGLKTALTGAVDARVDNNATSVDGKIELKEGSYKAYGQELKVERGRLLFAGPPGNPDVDLRAVRVSRDGKVKAILALSGPLSKPRPHILSEPLLPDAEALSYLLTGNGLKQAGKSEGSEIAGAALSVGVSKSEPLLQQLGDRLGLDELSVNSEGGIEESSLILGKYLNPDLYLGYSQGLFNPEGAVLLRLKLSDRVEVESRSGNEQSVDLFYRLEHD